MCACERTSSDARVRGYIHAQILAAKFQVSMYVHADFLHLESLFVVICYRVQGTTIVHSRRINTLETTEIAAHRPSSYFSRNSVRKPPVWDPAGIKTVVALSGRSPERQIDREKAHCSSIPDLISSAMSDPAQFVTLVTPNDVLFGRGSGPNDHEGNIKFRDMVAKRKGEYMSTNHRQTKATIAKDVVNSVFQAQGRFLKKLEAAELQKLGFPASTEIYQIVDDNTVMEKAKQALRQNRDKRDSEGKKSPTPKTAKVQAQAHKTDIVFPNFTGSLEAHENLEPLPIARASNPLSAPGQVHARPKENPGYVKYTTPLEGMATQESTSTTPEYMRRGPRRASVQSMSSRRDSLQLSEISMYKDAEGMSAMMESFKGMSTTDMENTSTDTIGTIDNMFGDETPHLSGISNMSNMSLSSVFNDKGGRGGRGRSKDAVGETGDNVWSFDDHQVAAGTGLWPLDEQRNSASMRPPAKRVLTSEQIASSLMAEPLQESGTAMMSTSDFPVGMSTGSLMMTSMDSISPQEDNSNTKKNSGQQASGPPQRVLPF